MTQPEKEMKRPPPIPIEYAGKWVAMTEDCMEVVSAGKTPEEAKEAAKKKGVTHFAYLWVPPAHVRFIGGGWL